MGTMAARTIVLAAMIQGSLAWSPALVGRTAPMRLDRVRACPSVRPAASSLKMGFLGFDFAELKNFGNLIIKCEASHILIKGPEATEFCNNLKKLAYKTVDIPAGIGLQDAFAMIAQEYSQCPSAKNGGSLGSFKPGQMVPEFDEVCFKYPVGQVHGPIETRFGSHLILIHSRSGDAEPKKSGCG